MNTRRVASAVLLGLCGLAVQAVAQDSPHRRAAAELHSLLVASDATAAYQLVANSMAAQDPLLNKHKTVVEQWLRDQIASPAYAEAKISTYVKVYSEEELTAILAMAKTPAFRVFQQKHQDTLRLSAPLLVRLAQEQQPELERRIQEAERRGR